MGLLILCQVCKCSKIKGGKKPEDYSKNLRLKMLSETHRVCSFLFCVLPRSPTPLSCVTSWKYLCSGSKQTFNHASFNHPINWSEINPVLFKLGVKSKTDLGKATFHPTWVTKNSPWPRLQEFLLPTHRLLWQRERKKKSGSDLLNEKYPQRKQQRQDSILGNSTQFKKLGNRLMDRIHADICQAYGIAMPVISIFRFHCICS